MSPKTGQSAQLNLVWYSYFGSVFLLRVCSGKTKLRDQYDLFARYNKQRVGIHLVEIVRFLPLPFKLSNICCCLSVWHLL